MRKSINIIGIVTIVLLGSCIRNSSPTSLKEGKWFGEFLIDEATIPFLFEVENSQSEVLPSITLINGEEKVLLTGVRVVGDSIYIPIHAYETELQGVLGNDTIKGHFRRLFDPEDSGVAFQAIHGDHPRFISDGSSPEDLDGKWDIDFLSEQGNRRNVGIFKRTGNILTGSILTTTGDYRYLEGISDQKGFRLSSFSGLTPYLLQGQFIDSDQFEGTFITPRGVQKIAGKRNPEAKLPDPYRLTEFTGESRRLGFRLPDLEGNPVSLSDEKFKNKVVVVSVLGSWCPNCLDEIEFLVPWYQENHERGVEVVGLAFERKDNFQDAKEILIRLKDKYNIPYDILFAGKTNSSKEVLPEIVKLLSYPTTFFIDKKGDIRKIHTGFSGPATGEFYEDFKKEFNLIINELLSE